MPNLKSIKRKIYSIKNTKQITKAMKMVAGAKLKRNQVAMAQFRPYALTFDEAIKNISKNTVLYSHPFFNQTRNPGNIPVGIIIITTDRGLCGSFNINLFKLFFDGLKNEGLDLKQAKLYILGKKGSDFFKKNNYNIIFKKFYNESKSIVNLSEELSGSVLNDYMEGKIGKVYIISNNYISTLHQKANLENILPFETQAVTEHQKSGGYLVEPVNYEEEIIDKIFRTYIQTKIYYKILESFAGEQAARMNAMDNATRNAEKFINKLTGVYNKARQTAVTLEILDIINGVNAIQ